MTKCSECKHYDPNFPQHGRKIIDWCRWYRRRIHKTFIRGDSDCPKFDLKIDEKKVTELIAPKSKEPSTLRQVWNVIRAENVKVEDIKEDEIKVVLPPPPPSFELSDKPEEVKPEIVTVKKEDLMKLDMTIMDKTVKKEKPKKQTKRRGRPKGTTKNIQKKE